MTSILNIAKTAWIERAEKDLPNVKFVEPWISFHYRTTCNLLLIFLALVCCTDFFGDPIRCTVIQDDKDNDPVIKEEILNNYCFISTTFTVPNYKGVEILSPNIAKTLGGYRYVYGKSETVYHAYYQWVPFFLLLQAVLFMAPYYYWKQVDKDKIKGLVQNLNLLEVALENPDNRPSEIQRVAKYLKYSAGYHVSYAFKYVMMEFSLLILYLFNIWITDLFLGKEFTSYGIQVLNFLQQDYQDRIDPMSRVFPLMTKCIFHKYGHSGQIERFDALCVLPTNMINEKIYAFLWFWFILMTICIWVSLVYRLATLISLRVRLNSLSINAFPKKTQFITVLKTLGTSQWFLLRFIRLNTNDITFQKIISAIYDEIVG